MTVSTLASELRNVAKTLNLVASERLTPAISAPIRAETAACSYIEQWWSGLWDDVGSTRYYNLASITPDTPLIIWPTPAAVLQNVRRWPTCSYSYVAGNIGMIAGCPDLRPVHDYGKRARAALEDGKASMISIFTTALSIHDDPLIREALEETKSTKPLTQPNAVKKEILAYRDRSGRAAPGGKGATAPHHMVYRASLTVLLDPGQRCGDLSTLASRMADHFDRISGISVASAKPGSRVFIGHGNSPAWRELKDFLDGRLGLQWEEFNRVPTAGIWTGDRLSSMLDNTAMAFLICTAEDEHTDNSRHARENVVHEAGLFQGRLGFARAIILLEEGCAEFSNVHGLGQIRFPKGNISASFEDIRKVLEREEIVQQSPDSGYRPLP